MDIVTAEEILNLSKLPLSAEQGRGLAEQVVGVAFERPEGRKIGREVGMDELEYVLRVEQIA
jgi:hypothetical protein